MNTSMYVNISRLHSQPFTLTCQFTDDDGENTILVHKNQFIKKDFTISLINTVQHIE